MTEPIKPALSAEEWAANASFGGAGKYSFIADELNETREANWAGIAAVALYGQPFGFTREMVMAMQWLITPFAGDQFAGMTAAQIETYRNGQYALVREAVVRVNALLPPEKP